MEIKDLSFEDGKIYVKREIKKEDFKQAFMNIKTKYKKYLTNFFEKYCNDTAYILTLTTYMNMLKGYLYTMNMNIRNDYIITKDDEKIYIKLYIDKFYEKNLTEYTKNQIEFLVNTKLEDLELEVLKNYFKVLENNDDIIKKIEYFLNTLINVDDIIQHYKDEIKEGKEIKSSTIDSEILKRLFAEFSLNVIKDSLKNDKEFMEN